MCQFKAMPCECLRHGTDHRLVTASTTTCRASSPRTNAGLQKTRPLTVRDFSHVFGSSILTPDASIASSLDKDIPVTPHPQRQPFGTQSLHKPPQLPTFEKSNVLLLGPTGSGERHPTLPSHENTVLIRIVFQARHCSFAPSPRSSTFPSPYRTLLHSLRYVLRKSSTDAVLTLCCLRPDVRALTVHCCPRLISSPRCR